jgi:DNA mismatch repair protein MutS
LESQRPQIYFRNLHHPAILLNGNTSKGNSALFGTLETLGPQLNEIDSSLWENSERKTAVLTGPSTGGKTTYERSIAIGLLMGYGGYPVVAQSSVISSANIVTNFSNTGDSTQSKTSTFRGQANRVANILAEVERNKPLVVFADEILTGTDAEHHRAAERAVLATIHLAPNTTSILATHDRSIVNLPEEFSGVFNMHVRSQDHSVEQGPSLEFNAFEVMEEAGVPKKVVERAKQYLNAPPQLILCSSI